MLQYELEEKIDNLRFWLRESTFEYQITQEKDKSLKSLFEVKRQFIQLIKTFVKESWSKELTEENIELADKEFITVNMHQTRADLIYRVKNEDIYFILLEFQSTEDSKMPYRLLSYMLEIWRRYEKDKLAVVIPCVLYTGNTKWKVKTFKSLFNVSKEIEKYIPDFEYVLIDVNRYTDKELIETANLVSTVAYMAKSKDKDEVIEKLDNIINLIRKLDKKEQESFIKWTEGVFYKYDVVHDYIEEKLYKNKEEKDMALADLIPEVVETLREQGRAQGLERGLEQGRMQGVREGINVGRAEERKKQLKRILTKKLKCEPSKKILSLMEKATEDSINIIEDKVFEITSWEEVEDIIKPEVKS